MAVKKSELYSSLWKSCDQLRGGMDASQYKDYVLVLLFVKYVSDKYAGRDDSVIVIPEGGSFQDMVKLKGSKHIGEGMDLVIAKLAAANELTGIIDVASFNDPEKLGSSPKDRVDRLTALVGIFEEPGLDFSRNRADGDDILGDAYEYLMQHFATESGKSKGQFYTPSEVSRVMAKVIGIEQATKSTQTVYDPTCGSGSLLLKAADEAPVELSIYGQEMDNATYALARMNMILHGYNTAEVQKGNTLADPKYLSELGGLKTHDFVVANPPFSVKAWSNGVDTAHDPFDRFTGYGVPPVKNGDYAFLLHIVRSLNGTGKGAVVLPHGVLFRGNAEADIRRSLVQRGYLKAVVGLPPNLFYGTGIPACLLVLDKAGAADREGIFMMDASKGYLKDGAKNRLREQDIHRIVDVLGAQRDEPGYARLVPYTEIERNGYNLNIPRYVEGLGGEEQQDLDAHLRGGIPVADAAALAPYWAVCPALHDALLGPGDRAGYLSLRVAPDAVRGTVYEHPEFQAFQRSIEATYSAWAGRARATLLALDADTKPKQLLPLLAEDLLHTLAELPLLDRYDVYQNLMDYWAGTMQDDVYEVVAEGWKARPTKSKKGHYNSELVPRELVVARYLGGEQAAVDEATAALEEATRAREELEEEYAGEEGVLSDYATTGKLDRKAVAKRLKAAGPASGSAPAKRGRKAQATTGTMFAAQEATEAPTPPDTDADELAAVRAVGAAFEAEEEAKAAVDKAKNTLEAGLAKRYLAPLTADEVRTLVVDDKWLMTLHQGLSHELARLSGTLAHSLTELAQRYAQPLPTLETEVATHQARVNSYLATLGFSAN
ncbi:MAG: type I restriction-modification system subunit M [Janthinobacterium lividum]